MSSRLTYTEELLVEKGATAARFCHRAAKFFRRQGIRPIKRVLSDNGAKWSSNAERTSAWPPGSSTTTT